MPVIITTEEFLHENIGALVQIRQGLKLGDEKLMIDRDLLITIEHHLTVLNVFIKAHHDYSGGL